MGTFRKFFETSTDRVLIIMRGVPGSGKSHKAKQLAGDSGVVFGTDEFWGTDPAIYRQNWSQAEKDGVVGEKLGQYHHQNFERTVEAMKQGTTPIVVDNTNIRLQHFQGYVDAAKQHGYQVRYEESDYEPWKKVRSHVSSKNQTELDKAADFFHQNNQHGVPKSSILRMLQQFEDLPQNEASLRNLLQPVPQSPDWHKEGNVFKHTQLVRKQLQVAVEMLQDAASNPDSAFSELDMNLGSTDINLLRMGGWLHDIGKRSATTIGDDKWLQRHDAGETVPHSSDIGAAGHEHPKHFEPMMQQLGQPWQAMHQNANPEDKQDLWFLIRNHMSLRNGLWSKRLWPELIDENGKYKNERKVKLLLTLVLMDRMGRYGDATPQFGFPEGLESLKAMQQTADRVKEQQLAQQQKRDSQKKFENPQDFIAYLQTKGLSPRQIQTNVQKKFGNNYDLS